MKTVLLLFTLLAFSLPALSQEEASRARAASEELKKGERAFRGGHFSVAEDHFRRALELDASDPRVAMLLARSIHRQYKNGSRAPEDVATGQRAITAYERVLSHDPADDDAFRAIVVIALGIGDEEKVRDALWQRANNAQVPAARRAESFVLLATKLWQCSYAMTERQEHKETVERDGNKSVVYRMPEDATEFYRAKQCANDGLMHAEQAIALAPESSDAWTNKAKLLGELAKLAQMEGDEFSASQYERARESANESASRFLPSGRERANKPGAPDTSMVEDLQSIIAPQQPARTSAAPSAGEDDDGRPVANAADGSGTVSAGVLNARATSKPAPLYPSEARAAGAQGIVTVQVVVDETGRVVTARAISGHPMLHAAAQEAALKATFAPAMLSGQPVKMSGVITYNFTLD